MELSFFIKGIALGFSIAAPVGPIGILCIQRTLAHGIGIGLMSGLGAAAADTIYGLIAGFGITFITQSLIALRFVIGLAGSIFLTYLGVTTFFAQSTPPTDTPTASGGFTRAFSTTFFLTLANPMTIISFMAITAGMGLTQADDYNSTLLFVAGVFVGSLIWWLLLCSFVGYVRTTITATTIAKINKISGLLILIFAVATLLSIW